MLRGLGRSPFATEGPQAPWGRGSPWPTHRRRFKARR